MKLAQILCESLFNSRASERWLVWHQLSSSGPLHGAKTKGEHPNTKVHWTWGESRTSFKINWLINWRPDRNIMACRPKMFLSHLRWTTHQSPPHVITSDYSPSYSKDRFPPRNRSCGEIPTPRITYVDNRRHNYVLAFLCRKLGPKASKAASTCEGNRLEVSTLKWK